MGAGASSLQRARKVLVIRAYNARKKNETLSEQFQSMTKTDKDGQRIIRLADVKAALGLSKAAWFDDVVMRVTHTEVLSFYEAVSYHPLTRTSLRNGLSSRLAPGRDSERRLVSPISKHRRIGK